MPVGLPPSPTRQDSLLKVHEAKLKETVADDDPPQVDGTGKDWKDKLPRLKHTAFKEDEEEEVAYTHSQKYERTHT
jgi:hypothetical protein